jgi:hypothetical protein
MGEHRATFRLRPVPEEYANVYRRRGMELPALSGPHSPGALVPYRFRRFHESWATEHGFFWLPCDLCSRPFGGHEIHGSIPDPMKGEGWGIGICPACTAERNGGVA